MIDGSSQVAAGIDQGTVQIEADDVEGKAQIQPPKPVRVERSRDTAKARLSYWYLDFARYERK